MPPISTLCIQPFQTVSEDISIWPMGPKQSVNIPHLTAPYRSYLLTYTSLFNTDQMTVF